MPGLLRLDQRVGLETPARDRGLLQKGLGPETSQPYVTDTSRAHKLLHGEIIAIKSDKFPAVTGIFLIRILNLPMNPQAPVTASKAPWIHLLAPERVLRSELVP